jgi:serine/threonine protein kinase
MSDPVLADRPMTCPRCGAPLADGDAKGLCHACLMAEVMQPSEISSEENDMQPTIRVGAPSASQPRNDAPDLPLPEELTALLPQGNYQVESFLGQGGMGAVYKGVQVRLKRPVAIKIMRRDQGQDYGFEQRFEREAQAMAKLNHPGIVSVIDYGEAGEDYLYIVMELVDGADMMDVIRGGQMTQEMALTLLPQICDALQFAHDHGIVHRDIKPSNIMLTRDGRIKMADFGLAKPMDGLESSFRTQTGTGMGTPDYAAPEQFDPHGHIDHRADIYALGVMIYQMITGQLPRGVWRPPSQRAEIAPQWDDIVAHAMQNDPADRYQQASEIKTDVSRITPPCRASVSDANPAQPSHRDGLQPERRALASAPTKPRAPAIAATLVITAVLCTIGFLALRKPSVEQASGLTSDKVERAPSLPETQTATGLVAPPSAPALAGSGWKPLFSDANWQAAAKGREFKDGWLRVTDTSLTKPRLSSEGVIRASVQVKEGSDSPAIVFWQPQTGLEYRVRIEMDGEGQAIGLALERIPNPSAKAEILAVDRRATAFPKGAGPFNLEVNARGEEITAKVNGTAGIRAKVADLGQMLEWGISAKDAWFQSVLVQPVAESGRAAAPSAAASEDGRAAAPAAASKGVADTKPPNAALAGASALPSATTPATATKDAPFVNSLGMKFVPVPITGGPTDKQRVLFSVWETRVQDYEAFVKETKREWPKPGFEQGPTHPAVMVSWEDAAAFCAWLTEKERKAGKLAGTEAYRLPSDHEWSCAAGVGDLEDASEGFIPGGQQAKSFRDGFFFWGKGTIPAGVGNFADDSIPDLPLWKDIERIPNYHDGHPFTSPVGSFPANTNGLTDLDGNAREMCTTLRPDLRVIRGGSWKSEMRRCRVMWRDGGTGDSLADHHGFRIVLAPSVAK